ncbi:HDIG domain-containing metalloprotein [Desulfogranum mediterraneum]|uniref:HDIG domain-containing metalloprotein n=1 Tax=Desulfogranum mediterraneum TaxID=160661 RepID=UPI000492131B|nr:HDIG domain-containing metalloprotein [Desulfogranum mediterraneum]
MEPRIPGLAACAALMDHYGMLSNIRRHSLVVAQLADQIITTLLRRGLPAPPGGRELIIAGALLHDIAKTPCLKGACDHARVGAEICAEHGYPEVAIIVAEHVLLKGHEPERCSQGRFTAQEIVYYADKRVRHDRVVSLDERLEYILEHYGENDPVRQELIARNFSRCQELEEQLFQFLGFPAGSLGRA